MTCSSCGTRTSSNQRNCPNCGRSLTASGGSRTGLEDSPSGSGSHGLSESTAKAPGRKDKPRDSEGQKSVRRTKKKGSAKPLPEIPLDSPSDSADGASGVGGGGAGAQIRAQLYDRPDCLEDGLSIYTDGKAEPVGIDYATEVGTIDLLARDDAGGLVVVLIAKEPLEGETKSGKDLVSEALERVGWVRKHIAESQQEVRAIVLLDQVPDDISYSAAAVAATVSFKTWRMEISFSDVEV